MKLFTSKTQQIGELGETETSKYLEKLGYKIIERNYTRKWGEIDIVAKKGNILHFIEVKSLKIKDSVSYETYRPEENMHFSKIKRLKRAIQTYLMDRGVSDDIEWQFDLACVYLREKDTKIKILENIILM